MSELDRLKQKILIGSRALYSPYGITNVENGYSGHVSGRLPGQDTYLVAGHTHHEGRSTMGDVEYEDLLTVDVKTGKKISGQKPLLDESIIHTAVYRARNDVNGIVHAHPFWCTVLSLTEKTIMELPILYTGRFWIASEGDGKKLIESLGDGRVVLHPGHGVVIVGATVEQACIYTNQLESLAQKLFYASLLGNIPKTRVQPILERSADPVGVDQWLWYERKLKEKGLYPSLP